jgi:hypothetical protein
VICSILQDQERRRNEIALQGVMPQLRVSWGRKAGTGSELFSSEQYPTLHYPMLGDAPIHGRASSPCWAFLQPSHFFRQSYPAHSTAQRGCSSCPSRANKDGTPAMPTNDGFGLDGQKG